MTTETPSEPPQPAAVASACNVELPTKEHLPAQREAALVTVTSLSNKAMHSTTNLNIKKDNTGMMDGRKLDDGNTVLSSNPVSGINKVMSSNTGRDANMSEEPLSQPNSGA